MSAPRKHALTPEEERHVAELLNRWLGRTRVAVSAYNDATTRTLAAERRLGIPAAILGAVVATGVFATVEKNPALVWRLLTGVLALLAAILTALQTFLRQAERSEQYREAARTYGRIRRRIERAMLFPRPSREDVLALLEDLGELIDHPDAVSRTCRSAFGIGRTIRSTARATRAGSAPSVFASEIICGLESATIRRSRCPRRTSSISPDWTAPPSSSSRDSARQRRRTCSRHQ